LSECVGKQHIAKLAYLVSIKAVRFYDAGQAGCTNMHIPAKLHRFKSTYFEISFVFEIRKLTSILQ